MEAGNGILVDQSFCPKMNDSSIRSSLLPRSNNPLLLHIPRVPYGSGPLFLGPCHPMPSSQRPPLAPLNSCPPNFSLLQIRPPLLPLPLARSSSLPPPISTARMRGTMSVPSARSLNKEERKQAKSPAKQPKTSHGGLAKTRKELHPAVDLHSEEDNGSAVDVYSLSPPPTSLPMPKFSLKTRTPSSSSPCMAETVTGDTTQTDAGASADLRRLLRL